MQDLLQEDGIHRGIVLPTVLLLSDAMQRLIIGVIYVLFRPFSCVAFCCWEIIQAVWDIVYTTFEVSLLVVYDLLAVPCLLLSVCVWLVWVVICKLWIFMRGLVAVSILVFPFVASNENLRNQIFPRLIAAKTSFERLLQNWIQEGRRLRLGERHAMDLLHETLPVPETGIDYNVNNIAQRLEAFTYTEARNYDMFIDAVEMRHTN